MPRRRTPTLAPRIAENWMWQSEAQRTLCVSARTMTRLREDGTLKSKPWNGRIIVLRADVERLLETTAKV